MQLGPIDTGYLHQEEIGGVIAEGLTVLYDKQPKNPVEYLANWLLQYCKTVEKQQIYDNNAQLTQQRQQVFVSVQMAKQRQTELKASIIAAQEQKEQDKLQYIYSHPYHDEVMVVEFPDYLKNKLNLSGVNICRYVQRRLEVDTDLVDDEAAFIDQKSSKLLKYVGTSTNQTYLLGKYLSEQAIITYEVLKPMTPLEDGTIPKNIGQYIPYVTKDPRVYYHRYPALGSYYAIPMNYDSYLIEAAFDTGLINRLKYNSDVDKQNAEQQEKLHQLNEKLSQTESEEDKQILQDEYDAYVSGLQEFEEQELLSAKQELILCVDTLGQDRQLTLGERQALLDQAEQFAISYSKFELTALSKDIDDQVQYLKSLGEYDLEEEENLYIEDKAVNFEELKEHNEMEYNYEIDCLRLDFIRHKFEDEAIVQAILSLASRRLLKFQNIFKAILFLLGYNKEEITFENALKWKEVKELINKELIVKFLALNHRGPRQVPLPYATIERIEKFIDKYDEAKVFEYNISLGLLYQFIHKYCKLRRQDAEVRKQKRIQKIQDIQIATEKVREMTEQKEIALKHAIESFEGEEDQQFNEVEWLDEWNKEHQLPEVEAHPEEDYDGDLE